MRICVEMQSQNTSSPDSTSPFQMSISEVADSSTLEAAPGSFPGSWRPMELLQIPSGTLDPDDLLPQLQLSCLSWRSEISQICDQSPTF